VVLSVLGGILTSYQYSLAHGSFLACTALSLFFSWFLGFLVTVHFSGFVTLSNALAHTVRCAASL
jgi:hypothetical protein